MNRLPEEVAAGDDLREHPEHKACVRLRGRRVCPENAVCDEAGEFHCLRGFRAHELGCVEKEEITREAQRYASELERALQECKGNFACGVKESPYLSWAEIKTSIRDSLTT